jgi:hypothetical protein
MVFLYYIMEIAYTIAIFEFVPELDGGINSNHREEGARKDRVVSGDPFMI